MPRGARKAATREETEETRHAILQTAERLFMEYGYRAVSTRQIADACGFTQPALYHHFKDKQTLYIEVIKEHSGRTQAALERIARRNEPIAERLRLVIRYLAGTTQHDIGLMLHDMKHEIDVQGQQVMHNLFMTGLIAPIASIFEEGIRKGALCSPQEGGIDPMTATHLFMSMLSRFLRKPLYAFEQEERCEDTTLVDTQQPEIIIHVLLHGIAKKPSTT